MEFSEEMTTVIERLMMIEKRYLELNEELMNPEIISNVKETLKRTKEQAMLKDAYDAYQKYKQLESGIKDAKEMLHDEELGEMAREELNVLEEEKSELEKEIEEVKQRIVELEEEQKQKLDKKENLSQNREKFQKELNDKQKELEELTKKLSDKELEIEGKNIYISLIGDGASLKKEEYQVYKLLSEASKGKDRLEISELNDYAKKHYSNYSIYINKMVNETRNELYHMQFIDKKEEKTYRQSKSANMFFNGILCIYVFLLTFTGILHIPSFQMPIDISLAVGWRESLTTFVIGILPLMLVILYSLHLKAKIEDKIAVITQKGYDEKIQWEALKRFLDDYSLLNEKEVPQLAVWEKYLVYATAFGIANKVIDQMKAKYPTVFLEDSWDDEMKKNYPIIYFSTNPIYYSTHTIGTSTISMLGQGVSKAYSTSVAEIAAHNASSGSGGGGGFSGGGGRRRWPEAGMGGR